MKSLSILIEKKLKYTHMKKKIRRVLDNTFVDPFVAQSKDFVFDSDFLELYFADSEEKKKICQNDFSTKKRV